MLHSVCKNNINCMARRFYSGHSQQGYEYSFEMYFFIQHCLAVSEELKWKKKPWIHTCHNRHTDYTHGAGNQEIFVLPQHPS